MSDLIKKIKEKMEERNYWLHATNGDKSVLYFSTPVGEKPNFACEVHIKNKDDVQFKFKYLTKKCVMLFTDCIGSFFDDKHFHQFEVDFWGLCTTLYNFEETRIEPNEEN